MSGKGGWDSGEIETVAFTMLSCTIQRVERVDGTQARLKPINWIVTDPRRMRGKGGWDSGEIETCPT